MYIKYIVYYAPTLTTDFDGDDMISIPDMKNVINRLTGEQQLSDEDMDQLIENVRPVRLLERCTVSGSPLPGSGARSYIFILACNKI